MKKYILFLSFIFPTVIFSARLNENFTSTTFPPIGWRVINNDGGLYTWERYQTNPRTLPACVSSKFEGSGLRNDDWLITPKLVCSQLSADTLIFWYRKSSVGGIRESLEVKLSTTGNNINDFTTILWIGSFTNTTYLEKKISLDLFDGQEVYIAFINKGQDQARINLDDITGPEMVEIKDVGVDTIFIPNSFVMRPLGSGFQPQAKIRNYSNTIQRNFPIICSIVGHGSILHYENIKYLDSLLVDSSKTVTFDSFIPMIAEVCTVKIRTLLVNDINPINDQKIKSTQIISGQYTGGPDAGYYFWIDSDTIGGPFFNWHDISLTGIPLPTGSANISLPIPIGFDFYYYGQPKSWFYYSTNGFISFDELTLSYANNLPIPASDLPNNIIAPFWDKLFVYNGRHQLFGVAPNRYKIIQWNAICNPSGAYKDTVIFQSILYENGDIVFQYQRCDNRFNFGQGESATVGIENGFGTSGLQYLYNSLPLGNLLGSGRAIRFYRSFHDVMIDTILTSQVGINETIAPTVVVKNIGSEVESLLTVVNIADEHTLIYVDSIKTYNFLPMQSCTLRFSDWIANDYGTYTIKAWTIIENDMNPDNDTIEQILEVSIPAPILICPVNNFLTKLGTITFDWSEIIGATRYQLIVIRNSSSNNHYEIASPRKDNSRNCHCERQKGARQSPNEIVLASLRKDRTEQSQVVIDTIIADTELGPLQFSEGSYSWQVRAGNLNRWGFWSESFCFTIDMTPPLSPVLISPAQNCTLSTPIFVWHKVNDADTYQIVVSKDRNTIINQTTTDTTFELSQFLENGRYFWKVRCRDIAGNWSYFSPIRSFYIYSILWQQKDTVPSLFSNKPVKDGGCITALGSKLYALKGNNTQDFYEYDIATNQWINRSQIPFYIENFNVIKRRVKAGADLVSAESIIFAIKGNNTREFWAYYPNSDSWANKSFIPSAKGLKAGSNLTYYNGNIYCLVGSGFEFYRYEIGKDSWYLLHPAPAGHYNRKFRSGSSIAYGGNGQIYALKGSGNYNEFYCYNINNNSWEERESLPYFHPFVRKKRKVKAGGAICYDGEQKIYAIKGGGENEFWQYDILTNHWQALETIPKLHKRSVVKNGADITYADGRLWLLKGNKTKEFWAYRIPSIDQNLENIRPAYFMNCNKTITEGDRINKYKIVYYKNDNNSAVIKMFLKNKDVKVFDIQGRLISNPAGLRNGIYIIRY